MAPIIQLITTANVVAGETWVLKGLGVTLATLLWSPGGCVQDGTRNRHSCTVPHVETEAQPLFGRDPLSTLRPDNT